MPAELLRITVVEAARRLGVSGQTVRRRLEAGELAGEREPARRGAGWRWLVLLPASAQAPDPPPGAPGGTPEPPLLAELRARIVSLEEHLAEAERAASETRQLLGGALTRLEGAEERLRLAASATAGPAVAQQPQHHRGNASGRPWWRPWG